MYKLIALDMDGTLLTSEKKVSEDTKKALKKAEEKGVKVVLATGRPLAGITKFLEELELFKGDDYALSFNGGLVLNTKTKEVIYEACLKGSDLKYMNKLAQELNVNIHAFSAREGLITPKMNQYTEHESTLNGIDVTIRDFNEVDDDEDIIKIMLIDPQEILDEAIKKLPAEIYEKYNSFKSAPFFFEVTNKRVDKGMGLKQLGEHLGIKQEEIIACGDAENDLSMVKYAGLGVAMENAMDSVKEHADYITSSNDEGGIVKVIEKFIM
ncbi:MAG: sugar-phosphatase [Clostridium sp.]|nr:sugar-phosphatase [Clostridium sp.]